MSGRSWFELLRCRWALVLLSVLVLVPSSFGVVTVTTDYVYDGTGQATCTYDYNGSITYRYRTTGYDQLGRAWSVRRQLSAGGSGGNGDHVTLTAYDVAGNVVTTSIQLDGTDTTISGSDINTIYEYDALGRRITTTAPGEGATVYAYDEGGNVVTMTDPTDGVTVYEYDELNRVTKVTDPEEGVRQTDYDSISRVRRVVSKDSSDSEMHQVRYAYDNAGRQTLMAVMANASSALGTSPSSSTDQVTETVYDAGGRVLTQISPSGQQTRYAYHARGWLTKAVYDAVGGVSQDLEYDETTAQVTARYDYDGSGSVVTTESIYTYPTYASRYVTQVVSSSGDDSVTSIYNYNAGGHLVWQRDPKETLTYYYYDRLGRRYEERVYAGTVQEWAYTYWYYDRASRMTSLVFADYNYLVPQTTAYAYDKAGRCLTVTYEDSGEITYAYDAGGRLITCTDPRSTEVAYSYDDAGRLVGRSGPGRSDVYAYDDMGRMITSRTDYDGGGDDITLDWSYDTLGQVTEHGMDYDGTRQSVAYVYDDPSAQRITTTYPDGRAISYGYDDLGRISLIEDDGDTLAELAYLGTGYRYDSKLVYDPADAGTGSAAVRYQPDYDGLNRLTRLDWDSPADSNAQLVDIEYGYDDNDNPLYAYDHVNPTRSFAYDYDDRDRVIDYEYGLANSATKTTISELVAAQDYNYDVFGNWDSTDITPAGYDEQTETRSHNSVNELTEVVMGDHSRDYPMPDLYVDGVNGSDSTGDGSSGNPYATIDKAVEEANDADVILVEDGTSDSGFAIFSTDKQDLLIIAETVGDPNAASGHVYAGCQGIVIDGMAIGGNLQLYGQSTSDLVARNCQVGNYLFVGASSGAAPSGAMPLAVDCVAETEITVGPYGRAQYCRSAILYASDAGQLLDSVAEDSAQLWYESGVSSQRVANVIAPYLYIGALGAPPQSGGVDFSSDYNCFSGDGSNRVACWENFSQWPLVTTYYDDMDDWQAVGLVDAHSIEASPSFTDADGADDTASTIADNDYTLTSDSPCIDRGIPGCPARLGYGGRTDIGAYEYDTRSSGTASLAYDAAGNLTSDGDKVYAYDALGRLTYVASNANTNVALASYAYDGLGRLAMKIRYDYAQDGADLYDASNTTRYYYYDSPPASASIADGGRQILPQLIETTDGTHVTDQYVWGPSYVDELIAHDRDTDTDGSLDTLQLAVHDRQYSTLGIVDPAGEMQQRYRYSPYGANPIDPRIGLAMAQDTSGNDLAMTEIATDVLYTGVHYDTTIGLNHHTERRLSHNLGRWTRRDPLGITPLLDGALGSRSILSLEPTGQYNDGSNAMEYVRSRPLTLVDADGRAPISPDRTPVMIAARKSIFRQYFVLNSSEVKNGRTLICRNPYVVVFETYKQCKCTCGGCEGTPGSAKWNNDMVVFGGRFDKKNHVQTVRPPRPATDHLAAGYGSGSTFLGSCAAFVGAAVEHGPALVGGGRSGGGCHDYCFERCTRDRPSH